MKAQMRNQISTTLAIFLALAVVYVVLIVLAQSIADPFARDVMTSIGSAIFGSGLTFFLIRIFLSAEKYN